MRLQVRFWASRKCVRRLLLLGKSLWEKSVHGYHWPEERFLCKNVQCNYVLAKWCKGESKLCETCQGLQGQKGLPNVQKPCGGAVSQSLMGDCRRREQYCPSIAALRIPVSTLIMGILSVRNPRKLSTVSPTLSWAFARAGLARKPSVLTSEMSNVNQRLSGSLF